MVGRFLHRNEGTISVQYLSSLEESRAFVKKSAIREYFGLLMDVFKLEINPSLILNMDETGCSSKPDKNTKSKCVVHSGSLTKPYFQENDDYRQVSIVSTIALNGSSLKPLLIIPRKKYINY